MKKLSSSLVSTASSAAGDAKLGQPVPESNFSLDLNRALPQAAQR
jgi:hypothetical protein